MDEIYSAITAKLRAAGYTGTIEGEAFYETLCDAAEELPEGRHTVTLNFEDSLIWEVTVDVLDEQLDLKTLHLTGGPIDSFIDFDAP